MLEILVTSEFIKTHLLLQKDSFKQYANLKKIELRDIPQLEARGIVEAIEAKVFVDLDTLLIRSIDWEVPMSKEYFPNLKVLKIFQLDHARCTALDLNLSTLEELYLYKCENLEMVVVESSSLIKFSCHSSKQVKNILLNASGLESLSLDHTVELSFLEISKENKLKSVRIERCDHLASIDMPSLKFLETIEMHTCAIEAIDQTMEKLKSLTLSECSLTNLNLTGLPALKTLSVRECDSLTALTVDNPAVQEIYLADNKLLKTLGITNAKSLTKLLLRGAGFQDVTVSDLPNLSYLSLESCENISKLPFPFKQLKLLVHFDYSFSKLDTLDFASQVIREPGICAEIKAGAVLNLGKFKVYLSMTQKYLMDDISALLTEKGRELKLGPLLNALTTVYKQTDNISLRFTIATLIPPTTYYRSFKLNGGTENELLKAVDKLRPVLASLNLAFLTFLVDSRLLVSDQAIKMFEEESSVQCPVCLEKFEKLQNWQNGNGPASRLLWFSNCGHYACSKCVDTLESQTCVYCRQNIGTLVGYSKVSGLISGTLDELDHATEEVKLKLWSERFLSLKTLLA